MNKKTLDRILQITGILVVLGIFIFTLFNINIFTLEGVTKIPTLISGIVLFWGIYISWGWKTPILKRLVYRENLNGTWYGTYSSKDSLSNVHYEGEIAIVIRQSFLRLNVKSYTSKYLNYSFGEALNYDSHSDSHRLIYLYSQSQFNPTDDNTRKGTSELQLISEPKKDKLFGDFWTNHNSKGYLNLTRITVKHSKSFEEAKSYLNI